MAAAVAPAHRHQAVAAAAQADAQRRLQAHALRHELLRDSGERTAIETELGDARHAKAALRKRQAAVDAERGSGYRTGSRVLHDANPPDTSEAEAAAAANGVLHVSVGRPSAEHGGPKEAWGQATVAESAATGETVWERPSTTAVGWHWLTERQRNNMRLAQERLAAREALASADAAADPWLRRMPGPGFNAPSHADYARMGLTHPAELYGLGKWRRDGEDPRIEGLLTPPDPDAVVGDAARDAAREEEIAAWTRLYEQPRATRHDRAAASQQAHERSLLEEEAASLRRRQLNLLRSGILATENRAKDIRESLALGRVMTAHLREEVAEAKALRREREEEERVAQQTREFEAAQAAQRGLELEPTVPGLRPAYVRAVREGTHKVERRGKRERERGWRVNF